MRKFATALFAMFVAIFASSSAFAQMNPGILGSAGNGGPRAPLFESAPALGPTCPTVAPDRHAGEHLAQMNPGILRQPRPKSKTA